MFQLRYYLSFFKALTLRRLANLFLVKYSYYLSLLTRKNKHRGLPVTLAVEPTTSCNLHCPECPSGLRKFHRPTGFLKEETFDTILNQLSDSLLYITLYFQGEPLMHKQFPLFVKKLKERKIVTATSTNAHFLTERKSREIIEAGLDRLIVSLDGTDASTYQKYRRGGDFDKVTENISRFMKIRKELGAKAPYVELQFIVFKHNEHQIREIKRLGKDLGVDRTVLKTAQLYEFNEGNPLMPGLVKYSRYEEYEPGKYRIKNPLPNRCYRSWSSPVITWDGDVVPCCFDKDADHRLGNVRDHSFDEILKGKKYSAFLQQILDNRAAIEICRNCTER